MRQNGWSNTRWFVIVTAPSSFSSMTQMLSRDKVKVMRDRQSAIEFLQAMVRLDSAEEASSNA